MKDDPIKHLHPSAIVQMMLANTAFSTRHGVLDVHYIFELMRTKDKVFIEELLFDIHTLYSGLSDKEQHKLAHSAIAEICDIYTKLTTFSGRQP